MLPNRLLNVFTDIAYPVCRQDRHFYLCLLFFSLSRKASNAMSKLPKDISKANIPKKIEIISKVVISATSLPMYSSKLVSYIREATSNATLSALSWVLSINLLYQTDVRLSIHFFQSLLLFPICNSSSPESKSFDTKMGTLIKMLPLIL